MTLVRHGTSSGPGGQPLPFARAVEADGWLWVSGQVPLRDGEMVAGGIVPQARQAIANLVAILHEGGCRVEDVVRVGVWLDDARDFAAFNAVYAETFGAAPPARACVQSSLVVDAKVEIDCVAFRPDNRELKA